METNDTSESEEKVSMQIFGEIFIFLKSPKVINFLLEVLKEIVTSGDSCKSKSRCCRLIPTYLPTSSVDQSLIALAAML